VELFFVVPSERDQIPPTIKPGGVMIEARVQKQINETADL